MSGHAIELQSPIQEGHSSLSSTTQEQRQALGIRSTLPIVAKQLAPEHKVEERTHWSWNQVLVLLPLLLPGEKTSCTVPEDDADSGDGGAGVSPFATSSLYLPQRHSNVHHISHATCHMTCLSRSLMYQQKWHGRRVARTIRQSCCRRTH